MKTVQMCEVCKRGPCHYMRDFGACVTPKVEEETAATPIDKILMSSAYGKFGVASRDVFEV